MALRNICGRLLVGVGSSVTLDAVEAAKHPNFSSLQYGSMQLTMVSFTKLLLIQLRLTFFLQLNSCSRSWQSAGKKVLMRR